MRRSWTPIQSLWWPAPGGMDGYLVNGPEGYLAASLRTDPGAAAVDGNHSGEAMVSFVSNRASRLPCRRIKRPSGL